MSYIHVIVTPPLQIQKRLSPASQQAGPSQKQENGRNRGRGRGYRGRGWGYPSPPPPPTMVATKRLVRAETRPPTTRPPKGSKAQPKKIPKRVQLELRKKSHNKRTKKLFRERQKYANTTNNNIVNPSCCLEVANMDPHVFVHQIHVRLKQKCLMGTNGRLFNLQVQRLGGLECLTYIQDLFTICKQRMWL